MRTGAATDTAYRGIADLLTHGRIPRGGRLPAERELAEEFGVSRVSVRNALELLRDSGLVVNSPQRGWYASPDRVSEPPTALQSFTEMVSAAGHRPTSHILKCRSRWARQGEAEQLALEGEPRVIELRRVRGIDGRPIALEELAMPEELGSFLLEAPLEDTSLYALLEDRGITPARSSYAVHAEAVASEWAPLLGLTPGDPILVADEACYLEDSTPLLISMTRYRGDSYRFRADLFRR